MKVKINAGSVAGIVTSPPSKSMAHRSFLAAAMADGKSLISNVVFSQDMDATLGAVEALGAKVCRGEDWVEITGNGGKFAPISGVVDCCESGSTLRFLIPICSLTNAEVEFVGRGRLLARPQEVYANLFASQGLEFSHGKTIKIDGALKAGDYEIDGSVSSQFITGLLYTLPLLGGDSKIVITEPFESRSYVNLTIQTLKNFGVVVEWLDANTLAVAGNQKYVARDYVVEGDCSQAAFFAVLGAVAGGVDVGGIAEETLQGDNVVFDVLARSGAKFSYENGTYGYEKTELHGVEIDLADCPDLGPILMVLGLFCEGETVLINAGRLRVKESDRIAAMESEIGKMGGDIRVEGDTIYVRKSQLHGADLISHNDHRIAMAMSVAALLAGGSVTIDEAESVNKSFPNFYEVLETLGVDVEKI